MKNKITPEQYRQAKQALEYGTNTMGDILTRRVTLWGRYVINKKYVDIIQTALVRAEMLEDAMEALENLINEHSVVLRTVLQYEDGHRALSGVGDELTPARELLSRYNDEIK